MFRSPQPGDWAAEDEDTAPLPTPAPTSPPAAAAPAPAAAPKPRQDAPRQDARAGGRFDRSNSGGRFERDNGGRFDRNDSGGRFDRDREHAGGRFERGGGRFDRDYDRGGRSDRDYDRGGRYERDYDRGGRFDRDNDRGGRYERDNAGRYEGGGRADAGRWGHNADRGADRRGGRELPVEQGFVVSIKENFGFVSCMEKEGDLFFHISEAPVDVQLQDEVEFRVKYNQRSDKEMACQLVALPKGTIKVEEISDEFYDGVVTKSLPRGGHGGGRGFFNDDRHQREEPHGLIEITTTQQSKEDAEKDATEKQEESSEEGEKNADESPKKALTRREFVRFNSESVASNDTTTEGDEQEQTGRPRKSAIPHFGDEVHFRIAKHRKTGAKRAVEITITTSAREKLEKEIEAKLATMTRETGIVDRVKNGGGFIKCCDRPVDVYFPFHEIREPEQSEESDKKDDEQTEGNDQARRGRQGKSVIREGDEVSFFVYEDQEDDSARSRQRLTALRVQKLPPGSVSFEELVRADIEGLVSKLPKEPRNAPEVIGAITFEPVIADKAEEVTDAAVDTSVESQGKPSKKKKGKDGKSTKPKVPFRLCDTEDMSYVPRIDDKVIFDEVLDKRTGKHKAIKVRVLQLNPKDRETGTINAMKEDFGFIKCAERSGDAYFRFTDVMGNSRNFNNGTEVAFDVIADSKSDHIRATRLQILPRGTIKWEDVVAEGLEGKIVSVPSSRRGHHSTRGGRGDKMKQLPKFVSGKISFVTPEKQHLIDFLPSLKEEVDSAFLTSEDVTETPQNEVAEGDTTGEEGLKDDKAKSEIRISFPSSLSKFERAALHEYSDWLGLNHASQGEGSHRQLELFGEHKISTKTIQEKLATSTPQLTVEFKEDDVGDVRYNPHVGDRVKFDLVIVKRTKQFQCKAISCVEAAGTGAKSKPANPKSEGPKGEGIIVTVKPEGFGFIQPALTVPGSMEENLFFHIKEITTGQTLAELKEGTEVQYTIFVDEKKKKSRAMGIAVVPAGTIKKVIPESVKGIVTKASFLNRMKGGAKGRFMKNSANKASTLGRIRLANEGSNDDDAGSDADVDGESDDEAEETEQAAQENAEADSDEKDASDEAKKAGKKGAPQNTKKQSYVFNIRDIVDPAVVLREGDEVEFIPQIAPKNPRAAQIRLVESHAKQGVVTRITEDLGGIIRLDGEEPAIEARFTARNVLRGDVLSEGDRVEFAYRLPSAKNVPKKAKPEEKSSEKEADQDKTEEKNKDESEDAADSLLGLATSVLRLSSSANPESTSQRRGSRSVNSTLKEAMRQVGANAMVASRMAKGPDGTRGFSEGWNSNSKDDSTEVTTEVTSEKTETETSTTVTTTTTTTSTEENDA